MTTTLKFRNHEEFHRAAIQMVGAGALAGLTTHFFFPGTSLTLFHAQASPWSLAVVAVFTALGAMAPALRRQVDALASRIGLLALCAAALVLTLRAGEPLTAIAVFSVLFGLTLSWGTRGRKLVLTTVAGAVVALLGAFVFLRIGSARELTTLMPMWLVHTAAGGAFSLVSVFALLPRHVAIDRDDVTAAYRSLPASLTGEVHDLVKRGYELWTRAGGDLGQDDASRQSLREGVLRLFAVARRWQAVESTGAQTTPASLVDRMESLDKRIQETDDEITRTQYQQAKAALAEQLRYVKDIGTSRERVLARMHNYLAAMERLRMAVINLESTNASREAVDVQPLVNDLEKLGADMDSCSEALIEAERITLKE